MPSLDYPRQSASICGLSFSFATSPAMTRSLPLLLLPLTSLLLIQTPLLEAAEVNAAFDNAETIPVTAAGYTATGNTVDISLGFAPPAGTDLTIVRNTSTTFIEGTFDNLEQRIPGR